MILALVLLTVHFIGDFYTQKQAWIDCKIVNKHRSLGLFKHICVHAVLTTAAVLLVSSASLIDASIAIVVIVLTHYAIDIWKTYQAFSLFSFLADQSAHLIVICLVSFWLSTSSLAELISLLNALPIAHILLMLVSFMLVMKPLSLILYLVLRPYTAQMQASKDNIQGLENAGEQIGYLERALILSFILLNQFAAIGFLLAAKSVFRFGDMRRGSDRQLTEYIMLGTLLSFTLAIGLGQLTKYLLTLI